MKRGVRLLAAAAWLAIWAGPLSAAGPFEAKEYAARRARLMDNDPRRDRRHPRERRHPPTTGSSGRAMISPISPESKIPDAYLVIDGIRRESLLFFTIGEKGGGRRGHPPGPRSKSQGASRESKKSFRPSNSGPFLAGLSQRTRIFYTMFKPEELGPENSNEKFNALQRTMTLNPWDGRLTRELQFVRHLRDKFPQVDVRDCSALVWDLRKIKSPAEIEVLRRAARIGVKAHNALIQSTRPGVSEKALEAVFEFVCRLEGAVDMAYTPILMSGKNHAFGHYHKYDRILKDGDFIILDAGPDYADYHVDISTTFPASGAFTPRQKELYEAALAVRDVCLANYRPGVTFKQVGAAVEAMLKEKGLDRFAQDFRGIVRYGGYNHMIGLATHDVTGTFAGPDEVLAPGFVFACDIQLFRLEEEIGIRIEDTIAVTETGCENLSLGVPRTVAEIEALKKKDGLLQIFGETRSKRGKR